MHSERTGSASSASEMLLELLFVSLFCALFALQRSQVENQKLLLWEKKPILWLPVLTPNAQALGNTAEISTNSICKFQLQKRLYGLFI